MLNERDGGIGGVKVNAEGTTGYKAQVGVEYMNHTEVKMLCSADYWYYATNPSKSSRRRSANFDNGI